MNRKRIALLAVAAVAATAAVLVLWQRTRGSAGDANGIAGLAAASVQPTDSRSVETPDAVDAQQPPRSAGVDETVAASAPASVQRRFHDSTDYAAFIGSVLDDARAGDRDAQYYIHAALSFCDREFRYLFRRRKGTGWLTHDEALNQAVRQPWIPLPWVEDVEGKCRALMEGDRASLGDPKKWLEEAARQEQPVAMAVMAESLLRPTVDPIDAKTMARARDLLMSGLESKDPEVIWKIGELQYALSPDSEKSTSVQWAWWLVACERGYDCGSQSPLLQFTCLYDQCVPGETLVEYMKRTLQNFAGVEDLAREINANIDADAWSDIDIGS